MVTKFNIRCLTTFAYQDSLLTVLWVFPITNTDPFLSIGDRIRDPIFNLSHNDLKIAAAIANCTLFYYQGSNNFCLNYLVN